MPLTGRPLAAMPLTTMLGQRRRLIISTLCGLGIVCVNALWLFETWTGMLSELDRYGYPFLLVLFIGGLASIAAGPRLRRYAEMSVYGGVCLYFLAALFSFSVFQSANRVYTVANTLQWMPIVYVSAFVMFRRRVAMIAAGTVFGLSLVPSLAILVLRGADYWDVTIAALLVNAYVCHLLTLLALSLVALLDHEYERAALMARTMESAASTDGLTGVANRRGIDQWLSGLADPPGRHIGLLLFDVDRFKSVNDKHGHLVGDDLLVWLSALIGRQLRGTDFLGRWGGEELLVIAADTDAETALRLAERIRREVGEAVHSVVGRVTISAGVTLWTTGAPVSDALRIADNALYRAKAEGRNRVVMR